MMTTHRRSQSCGLAQVVLAALLNVCKKNVSRCVWRLSDERLTVFISMPSVPEYHAVILVVLGLA